MTTIVTSGYSLTQTLIRTVNKTITPTENWVLVVIADTCNAEEKWQGYPSVTTIAERTGFSRKAVSSALKSLKDKGILSTLPGYTGRCSHYIIHIEKIADARYATQAELDKPKEKSSNKGSKPVDKHPPVVQQSSHQQGFSHPDYDDGEEFDTPF